MNICGMARLKRVQELRWLGSLSQKRMGAWAWTSSKFQSKTKLLFLDLFGIFLDVLAQFG